jgi:hypothetical protein
VAITGGFRVHEGTHKRYRVPDLLTELEFKAYMAANFSVGVDFRELTEDERKRLDSGEPFVTYVPEPLDSDVELSRLRKALGIENIEELLKVKRDPKSEVRDPIVELDSKVMSQEEFTAKYGTVPEPRESRTSSTTKK